MDVKGESQATELVVRCDHPDYETQTNGAAIGELVCTACRQSLTARECTDIDRRAGD